MFIDAEENLFLPVKNSHVVLKYDPKGNLLMTLGEWDTPSDTGWSGRYSDVVARAAGPFNKSQRCRDFPVGGFVHFRWLWQRPRASLHRRRRTDRVLGAAGQDRAGRVSCSPRRLGAYRRAGFSWPIAKNNRIQIFDAGGNYLEQWLGLARPCDIYIDADEAIMFPNWTAL